MIGRRKAVRHAARLGAVLIGIVLAAGGWRWAGGNLGAIGEGQTAVYRSAQLGPEAMGRMVRAQGVRTVLNLRGCNPDEPWYRRERAATLDAGATQVDVAMATDQWMSRVQLAAVVELLDTVERPILIHCQWGAERTGLVSAFAVLLRPGGTIDEARAQFSPYYLYLPTADGRVMTAHLESYAAWLTRAGRAHSPDQFREWVSSHYKPGSPSREDWPYDPYALVVVSRPNEAPAAMTASDRVETERR